MLPMESAAHSRILIADDDRELCQLLADCLQREGFLTVLANNGEEALACLGNRSEPVDLVILDVMMPGPDGLETLRNLRAQHHVPVIMLSARGEPMDRAIGLELGADDYLAKPCLPRELIARVRAQLRHPAPLADGAIQAGSLTLLPGERRALVDANELLLTGAEFLLLLALTQHAGELIDRATLTRLALGRELERFDRSVDVHVSHLRHKLADASPRAPRIDAVRGAGYILIVAAA